MLNKWQLVEVTEPNKIRERRNTGQNIGSPHGTRLCALKSIESVNTVYVWEGKALKLLRDRIRDAMIVHGNSLAPKAPDLRSSLTGTTVLGVTDVRRHSIYFDVIVYHPLQRMSLMKSDKEGEFYFIGELSALANLEISPRATRSITFSYRPITVGFLIFLFRVRQNLLHRFYHYGA